MTKLAYKDIIKDNEIELFIRTYCAFRNSWKLKRRRSPDPLWAEKSCWWLSTGPYGYIAATDLKTIFKEILKVDRRVFHTWKSRAEIRIWFDLNKVVKIPKLSVNKSLDI